MNKNDARYIRTHKALQDAFENLIMNSKPGSINVSSITQAADVNRRTFYLHYETVDDMFDELADKLADELSLCIADASRSDPGNIGMLVRRIIDFIGENKPLHKKLICSSDYNRIFSRISERLAAGFIFSQNETLDHNQKFYFQLRLESTSFTIMNSIRQWLIQGEPISAEALTDCIVELTGLPGTLNTV